MHILAFNGSPRPRGNTFTLLAETMRGASDAGATLEGYTLSKLVIQGCQACDSCRKTLHCRLQDDMTPLYEKILTADAILIGTPVYFWSMSAQIKSFVDRWYALDLDPLRPQLRGKRMALVTPFADATPETASGVVFAFRSAAEYMGMRFYEPLLVTAGDVGDAAKNKQAMETAYNLGRELAS